MDRDVTARLRVVVADDERPARSFLVALLRSFNDVVVVGEAASGKEAVTIIEQERPDLALLDLQMPELDGFEQVINRVELEGSHGVLVIRGDERDERHSLFLQHAYDTDTVELGHLQVEEREVGPFLFDDRDRLFATRHLPDDRHIVERL